MAANEESRSVTIYINGEQADNTLKSLEASSRKARAEMRLLQLGSTEYLDKMKYLADVNAKLATQKDNVNALTKSYQQIDNTVNGLNKKLQAEQAILQTATIGTREYSDSLAAVTRSEANLEKHRQELERIKLEAKAAGTSMESLAAKVQLLTGDLEKLTPGTESFKAKMKELKESSGKLEEVKDDIKRVGGAFGWLKQEIGSVGMIAGGFLGFQFVTSQFQNIISQNAALADSITAIQKTTGMSEQAVRRLQSEFGKMDTRTPKAELNGLAEVAGKLGISGERDVLGFVKSANQIGVALGNSLGNTEEAINSLGKLTDIFKIKDTYGLETALLKTGSAITDLGNAGTANEGYIVQFTKAMGGIAPAANISIQNVLGLAATMDELGQPVEASTTAIGAFLTGIGADIPKFAKIAGMSIQDFSNLLKNDANQALITVLEKAKSTEGGLASLAANMSSLGVDGARGITALGVLSNNLDKLRDRENLSNQSFEKGMSLTDAYTEKNENFAATVEKLGKRFSALTSNTTLTDFFTKVIVVATSSVNLVNRNIEVLGNLIKAVVVGSIAFGTYRMAVAAATLAQSGWITTLLQSEAITKLVMLAETAWTVVKLTLTGRIREARTAMIGFNAVMGANPIGLVVAAIAAAIAAYSLYTSKVTYASKVQEAMNDVKANAAKQIVEEATRIQVLQKVLSSETVTREQKLIAVNKLREMMPEYLKGLSDDEVLTKKGTDAINKYVLALERKASAEAVTQKITELTKANLDLDGKPITDDDTSFWEKTKAGWNASNSAGRASNINAAARTNREVQKSENNAMIRELKKEYEKELNAELLDDKKTATGGPGSTSSGPSKTLESMQKNLSDLKGQLQTAEVGSKAFHELQKQIKDQQAEIDKYDPGKKSGKSKTESEQKKLLQEFEAQSEKYKALKFSALQDQLSNNEKQVSQEEEKFNKLIEEDKKFLQKKGITAKERNAIEEQITKLQIQKGEAVTNIRIRQEQELMVKIKQLRTGLAAVVETEYQKQVDQINKFYDEQERNAKGNADQLALITLNRQQDLSTAELTEKQRLEKEKQRLEAEGATLSGNRDTDRLAIINKKYDDEIAALKAKFSTELQATKEFQDAVDQINGNREKAIDISNKVTAKKERNKIVDDVEKYSGQAFSIFAKARKAETNHKLGELEKQKEAELSSKNLTEAQKKTINDKYTKLENAEKLKAWKADQRAALGQAIIAGALAVVKALPNLILAGIAGVAAGVEIAAIQSEDPPAYEAGGYSAVDYSKPQGYVNRPTLFANSSARPFVAGEGNKTEYIISSEQLKDPVIANFAAAMEANRGVRRFEAGGYSGAKLKNQSTTSTPVPIFNNNNDELLQEMRLTRQAIKDQKVILSRRLEEKENTKVVQIRNNSNA